ncbi:MAG TPA: matrixin family metalloprotease [Vicinamibacterales bacterium]
MRQHPILGRRAAVILSTVLAVGHACPAVAYQTYGISVGNRVVPVKWSRLPVRYFVTDRGATGITSAQFRDATARAFATWQNVKTASVSAEFVGFTTANPDEEDGQTTLGFLTRPDLERVLGSTSYVLDDTTGEILETDIFFNAAFQWSVASAGESGKFDLESIILHETGHLFGLGHSALGETELQSGGGRRVIAAEAVMFPIAFSAGNISDRTPRADDIAGLSEVYPRTGFSSGSGSVSGHVTKNGQGVLGAHVVAFNPATGVLVGNFTVDKQGTFAISSLTPGPYIIRVEPVDDADLDSFFDDSVIPDVDINFRIAYYQGFVVVPPGGGSQLAEVKVTAK